tara:strand:- start:339 stop:1316 length:978 start_codon:yes stop_codon:yes gene_type:complete
MIKTKYSNKKIILSGKKVIDLEAKALATLSDELNNDFAEAVTAILECKGKVIVSGIGKSGHIAKKIVSTLISTGTQAVFLHPTEALHGDLGLINSEDIIIFLSYSGKTEEINNLNNFLKKFKNLVISITQNNENILSKKSDISINLPKIIEACPNGLAPTTSTTLMIAMGDALAIALMKEKKFSSESFSNFHPGGNLGNKLKKIKSIMHCKTKVPLTHEDVLMSEVIIIMTQKGFGVVGVINQKKELIGIITDGDLRRNMTNLLDLKAKQVMTKSPVVLNENTLVIEALKKMEKLKITSIFCFSERNPQKPVGIIHIHDCLKLNL